MRNGKSGPEPGGTPRTRRCGYCGEPLLFQRRGAKFCSREHKEAARAARKRASDRLSTLRGGHPFPDDPRNYSDFGELPEDFEDDGQDDEHGIYAGDPGRAYGYDPDAAWHEQLAYTEAIEQIERRYDRLLEPFRAALRRNPGVRPVAIARIEQQRDAEIQKLVRTHERARALDNAVRQAPQRAVQAAERQQEQAALNAFGRDLPGGSRRYQAPVWTGRRTQDIATWR